MNKEVRVTLEHAVQPSTQTNYESTVRRFWMHLLQMWGADPNRDWTLVCNPDPMDAARWLQLCALTGCKLLQIPGF